MIKPTFAFLAAILAIAVQGCPDAAKFKDSGYPVSYDGTMQSISLDIPSISDANGTQQLGYFLSVTVLGCIRVRIVRDQFLVEVSVRSCNGSAFDYEQELTEALGMMQNSRLWISDKENGLVQFSECWTGGSLSFSVAVEKQCLSNKDAGPCRDIASGRKTLVALFNQKRSFDARDILPRGNNAGSVTAGQAVLLGLLLGAVNMMVFNRF